MGVGRGSSLLVICLAVVALSDKITQTTSTATTSGETPVSVIFTSKLSTFTVDLQNPSSAAFMERSSMIKTQLEPKFSSTFPSYKSMVVELFRNGSVVNEIKLRFDSTSVPSNTEIANAMLNMSTSVTGFDIEGSTISVNGFDVQGSTVAGFVSSGIAHSSSLLTAFCLTLLSYVLSSQQSRWS